MRVKPCSETMDALCMIWCTLLQYTGVLNVVTGAGVTGGALTAHPGVDKVKYTMYIYHSYT
jgi:acyl-CoA reductase-like NAD-dependent aldehyde dehydrogenase